MSKSAKKQSTTSSTTSAGHKPPNQLVSVSKTKKPDRDSKQSQVIAMLQSPTGATIAAMMKATGWQQHSVRGFLAGVVRKRVKLKLESKRVDGERIYRVAGSPHTKSTSRRPNP